MSQASEAARELLAATEALAGAVHAGEPDLLHLALERRDTAFEQVREVLPESPGDPERTLLQRVRALDRGILSAAREVQAEVRRELDALATARRAARDFHAQGREGGPRFIERRA